MGQTESKNKQQILNSTELNISQNEYNNLQSTCAVKQEAQNVIKGLRISGSKNIKLGQSNEARNQCLLKSYVKSQRDASVLNKTLNALEASQKTTGGMLAAKSESDTLIRNEIKTKLGQDTYNTVRKNCIADQLASNILEDAQITDSSGIAIDQTNKAFNECVSSYAAEQGITAKSVSESDSTSKTVQETKAGSLLGDFGILFLVAGVAVAAYVGYQIFGPPSFTDLPPETQLAIIVVGVLLVAMVLGGLYYYFFVSEEGFEDGRSIAIWTTPEETLNKNRLSEGYAAFNGEPNNTYHQYFT